MGDAWPLAEELQRLVEERTPEALEAAGGVDGLLRVLRSDADSGLSESAPAPETPAAATTQLLDGYAARRECYGANTLPAPELKLFWTFVREALRDRTLLVLCGAAAVSLAIAMYKTLRPRDREPLAWLEGATILLAVTIVILVNAVNDYRKQAQFQQLSLVNSSLSTVEAFRGDAQAPVQLAASEVVVGDVLAVDTGDVLSCDGVLLWGFSVKADESTLTGESKSVTKGRGDFMLSGTQIIQGTGRMLVVAVGANSVHGHMLASLHAEEPKDTPLQVKLGVLAEAIARVGLLCAALLLVCATATYTARHAGAWPPMTRIAEDVLGIVITCVTLIVVAVPEGLPMAVTLALAYGTLKMLQDKNLVRVLGACETMGGATCILSDKTGTLTQNRMSVACGVICGIRFRSEDANLEKLAAALSAARPVPSATLLDLFADSANVNSSAFVNADGQYMGSRTEAALLELTRKLGRGYVSARRALAGSIADLQPFSSENKHMFTVAVPRYAGDFAAPGTTAPAVLFDKGAAEIVLGFCTSVFTANGSKRPLGADGRAELEAQLEEMTRRGLRTLGFAVGAVEAQPIERQCGALLKELVWLGAVGIEDPLRPEVPAAIAQCATSGVSVRMVTGDNVATATQIARRCGILRDGGLIMEGAAFRALGPDGQRRVAPQLLVLARSRAVDKRVLVEHLKDLGETVAVTGDGTNDAAALRASHVGFAMGIGGTDVAKEASDIVLMDDNFASIVKAIMWGRAIHESVQKFLQFQLTVNITAIVLTFVSSVASAWTGAGSAESVLHPVQLLWVNLLMDTLAALALATEPPSPALLQRPPVRQTDPLVTDAMKGMIGAQALFQSALFLGLYFYGDRLLGLADGSAELATVVFNAFVLAQLFNEINCRLLGNGRFNVFAGIFTNRIFCAVWISCLAVQVAIVTYGHAAFHTTPLSLRLWVVSAALGAATLPVGLLVRLTRPFERLRALGAFSSGHRCVPPPRTDSQLLGPELPPGCAVYSAPLGGRGSADSLSALYGATLDRGHLHQALHVGIPDDDSDTAVLLPAPSSASVYSVHHARLYAAMWRVRRQLGVVNAFRRRRRDRFPQASIRG